MFQYFSVCTVQYINLYDILLSSLLTSRLWKAHWRQLSHHSACIRVTVRLLDDRYYDPQLRQQSKSLCSYAQTYYTLIPATNVFVKSTPNSFSQQSCHDT